MFLNHVFKNREEFLLSLNLLFLSFSPCYAQFGVMIQLDINPDSQNIPVLAVQNEGYASAKSLGEYNGTITSPLASFTVCFRAQISFTRPRMYVFTYAVDDDNTNELYAEFHLGRGAFRLCKKGTKFCAWMQGIPDFFEWIHICLAYDVYKDTFKIYADGEKVESGSWSENPNLVRPNGLLVIGQDQDNVGGGFDRRQSFSGYVSQMNVWNASLEDFHIENLAECRSDAWGNAVAWKEELYSLGEEYNEFTHMQLFQLCESGESEESKYFFFNAKWNYEFYKSWCYNQGGEIATPTSAEEYQKQLDIADRLIVPDLHEKCVKAGGSIIIWMGYNDMELEDEWRNPYSQEPITWEGAWKPGQPNGGVLENCIRTEDRLWADR